MDVNNEQQSNWTYPNQLPICSFLDVSVEIDGEIHPINDMPSSYLLTCSNPDGWKLIDKEYNNVISSEFNGQNEIVKPFRIWFGDTSENPTYWKRNIKLRRS